MNFKKNKLIALIISTMAFTTSISVNAQEDSFINIQTKNYNEIKEENPYKEVSFFNIKLDKKYNEQEIINILGNIYYDTGVLLKYRKAMRDNYISVIAVYNEINNLKNNLLYSHNILDVSLDRVISSPLVKNNIKEDKSYLKKEQSFNNYNYESTDFKLQSIDDEPDYPNQYYMDSYSTYTGASNIRAAIDQVYPLDPESEKVNISVIDVGYGSHEEIVDNIKGGYKFSTIYFDESTGEYGRGTNYQDYTEFDDGSGGTVVCEDGHGTAVSSLITASIDNTAGIAGIVDADLYMPKALDFDCVNNSEAFGLESDVADSIVWSVGGNIDSVSNIQEIADVVNLSIGRNSSPGCSNFLQQSINYAIDRNAIVVASAGNEDRDVFSYTPSGCSNIISVAGNDLTGLKVDSSNYGSPLVDFSVLGEGLTTADSPNGNSAYNTVEGTSFSAAIVSGIAGLFKQKYPTISHKEFEYYLKETANPHNENFSNLSENCTTGRCGAGIVDAGAAMDLAEIKINYPKTLDSYFAERNSCEDNIIKEAMNYYIDICQLYKISVTNTNEESDNYYEIISKDNAQQFWLINPVSDSVQPNITVERTVEVTPENINQEKTIFINNVDTQIKDYAVRMCDNDRCYAYKVLDFDDTENTKPLRCQ